MPTVGTDCHIILTHPDVNGGDPYGFILQDDDKDFGPGVSLQREIDSLGNVSVRLFFNIIFTDSLTAPNGLPYPNTFADAYAKLTEYLSKMENLIVETPIGIYANVGATGHSATELHHAAVSIVSCQLNNAGTYFPAADPVRYLSSVWSGDLTWATSYWR